MGVDFVDHYETLEIGRDADAHTIRSAWRRLARRDHPDVAGGREAARRFIRIREAYDVLSDPARRRWYDEWLERVSPSQPRRQQRLASTPGRRTIPAARAGACRRGVGL